MYNTRQTLKNQEFPDIENLNINDSKGGVNTETKAEEDTFQETQFEVKDVLDHKIKNGKYIFKILFSDRTVEWVKDEDCFCERLLSVYCRNKGIQTQFCVCRVSTKNQVGGTHLSLEAQEKLIQDNLEENDVIMGRERKDKKHVLPKRVKTIKISASAYKDIPTVLKTIGESCNRGDTIYIYRVDRLSRNIIKYLAWLEELDARGVYIHSIDENISYKDNRLDFIQHILNAQRESEGIGKRVKMTIQYRRRRGDDSLGSVPYGWRLQRGENGVLLRVQNQEEQLLMQRIKNSTSLYDLLNQFEREGLKKRGRKWNIGMLKRIRKGR
jgi:DNA invertase Pin-like site-specific DNA recombinase